jgi:hypothetical protein
MHRQALLSVQRVEEGKHTAATFLNFIRLAVRPLYCNNAFRVRKFCSFHCLYQRALHAAETINSIPCAVRWRLLPQ